MKAARPVRGAGRGNGSAVTPAPRPGPTSPSGCCVCLAAIRLGLTNSRLEGLHSKVRLLSHRSFGFHSPAPLISLIYLCAAGIEITLPNVTPNS